MGPAWRPAGRCQGRHDGRCQGGHDGRCQDGHDGRCQGGHDGRCQGGHDGSRLATHTGHRHVTGPLPLQSCGRQHGAKAVPWPKTAFSKALPPQCPTPHRLQQGPPSTVPNTAQPNGQLSRENIRLARRENAKTAGTAPMKTRNKQKLKLSASGYKPPRQSLPSHIASTQSVSHAMSVPLITVTRFQCLYPLSPSRVSMSVPLITVTGFQCLYPLSPSPGFNVCTPYHLHRVEGEFCCSVCAPYHLLRVEDEFCCNVCTPYHLHRVEGEFCSNVCTPYHLHRVEDEYRFTPPPPPPGVFIGKGKVVGSRPGEEGGAAGDTVTRKPSESGTWPRWFDTQPQKKAPNPSTSSAAVTRLGRCTALNGDGFTRTYRTQTLNAEGFTCT